MDSLASTKFQSGDGFDMITGHTRFHELLGHPIGQVQPPQAVNIVFGARSYDGVIVPLDVPPKGLSDVVTCLAMTANFLGALTRPYPTKPRYFGFPLGIRQRRSWSARLPSNVQPGMARLKRHVR